MVNLAAESHVDCSIEVPGACGSTSPPDCLYVATNVNGTFHHISTDEVFDSLYGDGQNGRD